jgi:putative transposase
MVRFQFKKGLKFFQGTKKWSLETINAHGTFVFNSDDKACERLTLKESDVYINWLGGLWTVDVDSLGPGADVVWIHTPPDVNSLPERDLCIVKKRNEYIKALKEEFAKEKKDLACDPMIISRVASRIAKETGDLKVPHWSTVWRWVKALEATKCLTSLRPGPKGGRKTNKDQKDVFNEVVDTVYLTEQKLPKKDVYMGVLDTYMRMNKGNSSHAKSSPPSRATVYRWIDELNYSIVQCQREGKRASQKFIREVTGRLNVEQILERYEIDHTPLDLLLVCGSTGLVPGRPWLTLVIDRFSRMIAGFYVGFNSPSAWSVMSAMKMAILPKENHMLMYPHVKNTWPAKGTPTLVALDNGMDLHAKAVQSFADEAQIILSFMPAGIPELKGAVERLFRTVSQDLLQKLPGTVFNSVKERGDYESEKLASLTLDEFNEIFVKWVVDNYHQKPHEGLKGKTPHQVWMENEKKVVMSYPAFPKQLDLMSGKTEMRRVFHYGISHENIKYNSSELNFLRIQKKERQTVRIKSYEDTVAYIDVQDPKTEEYFRVYAVDRKYVEGLNRHLHHEIQRKCRERFKDEATIENLLEVKREISEMVQKAVNDKKTRNRKNAAHKTLINSNAINPQKTLDALRIASRPVNLDVEEGISIFEISPESLPQIASVKVGGM